MIHPKDETEYLISSEANRKVLDESIQELEAGKGVKVSLDELIRFGCRGIDQGGANYTGITCNP